MKLKKLLSQLKYVRLENANDSEIKGISCDSNTVGPGYLFVAIKGRSHDGHDFIKDAIEKGAKAVVTQKDLSIDSQVTKILVKDSQVALASCASSFFSNPQEKLKLIGITGTNGKTTVSYLIEKILASSGLNSGVVGTVNYRVANKYYPAPNTTPQSDTLQAFLQEIVLNQAKYAIIEVSSHALDQRRVQGLDFSYAVFTNLSPEHLDYHGNLEDYFSCKSSLFKGLSPGALAVINADDVYGKKLIGLTKSDVLTFGIDSPAEIQAKNLKLNAKESHFTVVAPEGELDIKSPLIGRHNVYNMLAAIAVAVAEKIDHTSISASLAEFNVVPGRLECVDCGQDFLVFVDYAHTEDALENALTALRKVSEKSRIIVVFGCGGDRDKLKRPVMGRVATEGADLAIISSDNPRSEEPEKIISDITGGIDKQKDNYQVIPDRAKAISKALSFAKRGDIVLIAGKGHEATQIFAKETIHFNDREQIEKILTKK